MLASQLYLAWNSSSSSPRRVTVARENVMSRGRGAISTELAELAGVQPGFLVSILVTTESLGSNPLSVKCARNCFKFLRKGNISTEEHDFYGRATFLRKSTISTEGQYFYGRARFLRKGNISKEDLSLLYGNLRFVRNRT